MLLNAMNLTKSYHDITVIDDFSFHIDSSEIVVLLGRSGTGKTTLMRLLNNLEKADQGTISIEDAVLCKQGLKGAEYADRKTWCFKTMLCSRTFRCWKIFWRRRLPKNWVPAKNWRRKQPDYLSKWDWKTNWKQCRQLCPEARSKGSQSLGR